MREYLGIDGQSLKSALQFRDKLIMKQHFTKHGIPVANFRALNSAIDLIEFVEEYSYPVVVKPRSMAGSTGVTILKNKKDLIEFLNKGIPKDWLVETYIEGKMYHIDGLIKDGKVEFIVPSVYYTSCLDWSTGGFTASYMLSKKNDKYNKLVDFVTTALNTMELPKNSSFHAEVFWTPDNEMFLCEVASRTPGGRSNYEIYYGSNVNLNMTSLRLQCGLDVKIEPNIEKLAAHIYCPPKPGKLLHIPNEIPFENVVEYIPVAKTGSVYYEAQSSVDCLATIICTDTSEEKIKQSIEQIYSWFEDNLVWDK